MESSILQLKDGRYFIDENQSRIYATLLEKRPHYSSEYHWNEMSMADLFADCYKHNTLYCPEMKSWYTYDGSIWVVDTGSVIATDRLKEFVKLLNIYACELSSDEVDVAKYQKFVSSLSDRRARDRILKDAQSEACVYLDQFDKNPYLINCENGTYDLEHDTFHLHTPTDYLTLKTKCVYVVPTARSNYKCDRFFQFLDEITKNDKQKLDYLHRALGYSLVGVLPEECMFFAWGKTTRNGKGTLYESIVNLLGDYGGVADSKLICSSNANQSANAANPALCALRGKRLVIMSETDERDTIDSKIVKSYTGNDTISTRNLYGSQFTMRLQCTFWLMCNHLPKVNDHTIFDSDRAKVITFDRHFDENTRDTTLKKQFATDEAKAVIFMWLIEGYKKYLKEKLTEPECVKQAIKKYEVKDDFVKAFISECCTENETDEVSKQTIYESFENWRIKGDYPIIHKQNFYRKIDDLYESYTKGGYRYYKGIGLKQPKN